MNADSDQTRIEATSADEADLTGSEPPRSQPLVVGTTSSVDHVTSKSSSIAPPSIMVSGTVLPSGFDSERTVISKETPVAAVLPMSHLPPAEMGKLLAGQRLGHFELKEFVGGGGEGAVFPAL